MRACSLCKKKYEKGSGSLFHLPKDVGKRKLWAAICGRNFAPTSLICANHFRLNSIIRIKNKILLLPNAEPFIHKHADVEIPADYASNIPNAESHCLDQSNAHFAVDSSFLTEPSQNVSSSFFSWEELTSTGELPMEHQNQIFKEQYSQTDMAQIIDGKAIAAQIRAELRQEVNVFTAQGNRTPHLTCIIVGEDQASEAYVRNKIKAAKDVGITSETKHLPATTTEDKLLDLIEKLNKDSNVDGILVQLPVPEHMNERKICNAVVYEKDVDGFNVFNVGRMCLDMKSMIPATPLGVIELLKRTGIDTFGKNAVVVGRSKNVSMPIAMLMHADGRHETNAMDATVTICHRFTPAKELTKYCSMADIIITATGIPSLIKKEMVKPGACVIDIGITRITGSDGKTKLVGDVDYDEVRQVAGYITPVPGGVGPMTVAMLMQNTITAAKNLAAKKS